MTQDKILADSLETSTPPRKPRIALMGEFSAGKSTLLNMLLAQAPLPVRITATSVPPIWISYGKEAAIRVTHDGTEEALDIAEIGDTSLEDAKYIRLQLESDALEICDLIDMPGISDPNMSPETWQSIFSEVDNVIWCTHATQAWRQSEAATWEEISSQTKGNNLLVITQFDKIIKDRDRARLVARVEKETQGSFQAVFPLALIDAINAADEDAWAESGAAEFSEHLVDMLLRQTKGSPFTPRLSGDAEEEKVKSEFCDEIRLKKTHPAPDAPASAETPDDMADRIVPRRVVRNAVPNASQASSGQERLPPTEASALTARSRQCRIVTPAGHAYHCLASAAFFAPRLCGHPHDDQARP